MNDTGGDGARQIERLLAIMSRLRDPEGGCPWDVQQDFASIAPYTIEEAYEVADAIERENLDDLRDELGDLLFQVVFHAQMAREAGAFDFEDVARTVSDKMQRRHPHVFSDARIESADAQRASWEDIKADERAASGHDSVLDGVPRGMAELQRAAKLQKRAARVGFDWPSPSPVFDKIDEEMNELREAVTSGEAGAIEDELGDLLFAVTNLARKLDVNPARALRGANAKFERRFRAAESEAGGTEAMAKLDLDAQEALWQRAKRRPPGDGAGS